MDAFLTDIMGDEARKISCAPHPARWQQFEQNYQLEWTYTPFEASSQNEVPNDPGIYCFMVGLPPDCLPPVGYPLYVGKTERALRTRFREYLAEENDEGGRVRVRKFLKVFAGELYFASAVFQGTPEEVKALETAALDALMPAYSDLGFTAEVRAKRSAWQ